MGRDIALAQFVSFFHILPIMSQQQESPPRALDGFSRLPMEMNVQIMMFLNPQQLLSLTSASPAVRRHFLGDHRASILKPHLPIIYKYYGYPATIPLIVLLTRVRVLRARLRGRPRSEIENALHPILASVLSHDIMKMPPAWESDLQIIAAAISLIPEICQVFNKWQRRKWNRTKNGLSETRPQQRWIFIDYFLRFECLCNISYGPEDFLFQNLFDFEHIFLQRLQMNIAFSPSDLRPWSWDQDCEKRTYEYWLWTFNAPRYYIKKYQDLVRSVRQHLPPRSSTTTEPGRETPETTTEAEIMEFLGRTRHENELFCYHLSLQGNKLLTHLWSLKPQARSVSIIDKFSNFFASHPFRDSIYPGILEEMKYIHENYCFEKSDR